MVWQRCRTAPRRTRMEWASKCVAELSELNEAVEDIRRMGNMLRESQFSSKGDLMT